MNSHTQDWITDSWFLGSPDTHIQFISSNKIHLSNNEFNTVDNQIFIFDDTASLHCGDINITGGFMDARSGKNFLVDNRTNSNSKGIILAGVRMVTVNKTKFFNQSKDFQVNTYTSANLSGGYIYPNFEDDVILLNASGAALPVQLPAASTAIKRFLIKAINLTNGVTIYPNGSDSIEKDGALTSSYAFSEVNESVWLVPDAEKWRVLSADKPSGSGGSGSAIENVVEVSSSTYTIPLDKDIILANASSNSVTLTLPLKADKYAENRKNIVVKVITLLILSQSLPQGQIKLIL